ncbi:hypothetical protein HQO83_06050 [Rhodococcus fascians]|nr:hypothetical protein [Rhodococcus fascians]
MAFKHGKDAHRDQLSMRVLRRSPQRFETHSCRSDVEDLPQLVLDVHKAERVPIDPVRMLVNLCGMQGERDGVH